MKQVCVYAVFALFVMSGLGVADSGAWKVSVDAFNDTYMPGQVLKPSLQISSIKSAADTDAYVGFSIRNSRTNKLLALPHFQKIDLKPNTSFKYNYDGFLIPDGIDEGQYILETMLADSEGKILEKRATQFNITGTKKPIEMTLKTCNTPDCKDQKKVLTIGENIYLDYDSEVANLTVTATLTYPDKTIKQMTLPAAIKAEQVGTYMLNAKAEKKGYLSKELSTQFGVIKSNAEIKRMDYKKPSSKNLSQLINDILLKNNIGYEKILDINETSQDSIIVLIKEKRNFLGVIPLSVESEYRIENETVEAKHKPWWSFLAW